MSASLDVIMPIPSRTLGRGHPWPDICRRYLYEQLRNDSALSRAVGGQYSASWISQVRRADKWQEYGEQLAVIRTAERNGLAVPILLAGQSMDAAIQREHDERAERATDLQRQLARVIDRMASLPDTAMPQYLRLVQAVAALQAMIDMLLGLDAMRRVQTATAIARQRHAMRAKQVDPSRRIAEQAADRRAAPMIEPDLQVIMP